MERNHGLVYTCNDCGVELDTGREMFHFANEMRIEEGWKAVKQGAEWFHFCPDCAKDYAKKKGEENDARRKSKERD